MRIRPGFAVALALLLAPLACTEGATPELDAGGVESEPLDAGQPDAGMPAQLRAELSQFGITWTFDRAYPTGQFVNGDFWVVGPVTLVSILPASSVTAGRTVNGSMVNPLPTNGNRQGYDSAMCASYACPYEAALNFAAGLAPETPRTLPPASSLVSSISHPTAGNRPQLETAAVLTVLASAPAEGSFRPPYAGTEKAVRFNRAQLQTQLLPKLAPPTGTPPIATVARMFERPWLDHMQNWLARYQHPVQNLPDYGSSISNDSTSGALMLLLDLPAAERELLLVRYLQLGIDLAGVYAAGGTWPPNGGHSPGRKLPISVAALLLDDPAMKAAVENSKRDDFDENGGTYRAPSGRALYGQPGTCPNKESDYWRNVAFDTGSRTCPDPYGLIDGGWRPGGSYQFCCLSQPWKGTALVVHRMPGLRALWKNEAFFEYVDRWVTSGTWAAPDTCAPVPAGLVAADWTKYYGVTFGPDGKGGCIAGSGRFPELHGTFPDGGYYGSGFASAMWKAYRQL